MSATKEFLYELEEFVWLVEFAGLSFEQRGKAINLMRNSLAEKFGDATAGEFAEWFDLAYEFIEEDGGKDWATGLQAERLLSWVA
jgi:hypothetical protein